jgi:hypothetical protein
MKPPTGKATKCAREVSDFPADAYRLSDDGRKWLHKCRQRRDIALLYAIHANPDGSSVTLGTVTLSKKLKMPRAIVTQRIKELQQLGFVISTGWDPETHVRVRRLNLDVLKRLGLGEEQEARIDDGRGSDSPGKMLGLDGQEARIEEARIRVNSADSAVTTNPSLCTDLPTHTHTLPSGVSVLLAEATIAEYDWTITQAHRKEMDRLEQIHGREKFLAAGRSFLEHPPAAVNAKTRFGWSFFISGFEGFVARQVVAEREADRDVRMKADAASTDLFWGAKMPLDHISPEFIATIPADDQEYISKINAAKTVNDIPADGPARSLRLAELHLEWSRLKREKQEQSDREAAEDLFK